MKTIAITAAMLLCVSASAAEIVELQTEGQVYTLPVSPGTYVVELACTVDHAHQSVFHYLHSFQGTVTVGRESRSRGIHTWRRYHAGDTTSSDRAGANPLATPLALAPNVPSQWVGVAFMSARHENTPAYHLEMRHANDSSGTLRVQARVRRFADGRKSEQEIGQGDILCIILVP